MPETQYQIPTISQIQEAIKKGKAQYEHINQRGGCGRAYVCIGTVGDPFASAEQQKRDKAISVLIRNRVKDAVAGIGVRYLKKAYGVGDHALYIGYDNADGRAWSQAVQIVKNLKAIGVVAYEDGMGD